MNRLFKGLFGLVVSSSLYFTGTSFAQETKNQEKLPDFQIIGHKTRVLSAVGDYYPIMLWLLIRNNGDSDAELPLVKVKGKSPSGKDLSFSLYHEDDWYSYEQCLWTSQNHQHADAYRKQTLGQKKCVFVQKELGLLKKYETYTSEFSAAVDPENQIIESDEDNNDLKFSVSINHYKRMRTPAIERSLREKKLEEHTETANPATPLTPIEKKN